MADDGDATEACGGRAAQRFRLEIVEPGRLSRTWRTVSLLVIGLISDGRGPVNPGGRTARIVDVTSGAVVGEVGEPLGDDGGCSVRQLRGDLDRLDVGDFSARWLAMPRADA